MSFQFFSKLDNKFTDGPKTLLDPNNTRAKQKIAQSGGDMGRAIQYDLRNMKDNKRMARRAYRTAMRSGNINELAAAAEMINAAGGRFMGPGETERRVDLELERRTTTGELGRSRLDQEPGLGGLSRPSQSVVGDVASSRLTAAEESALKTRELTLAGNFGPRAQRELEERMKREEGGSLFQKSSKEDGIRFGRLYADQKRAEDTAFFNQVKSDEKNLEAEASRRERLGLDVPPIDPMEIFVAEEEAANMKSASEQSRLDRKARMSAIEKVEADRVAKYGEGGRSRTNSLESAGTEGAAAQAKIDRDSADRKRVNEMQSSITDSYLDAASLQFDSFRENKKPFIPHGVFGGSLKKESGGDPAVLKKSIDAASAFNSALGGKDVTVQYNEKDKTMIIGGAFGPKKKIGTINKVSSFGEKAVTFQNDAFSPLKDKILKASKSGGNIYQQLEEPKDRYDVFNKDNAIDKIVKAAVKANYPIELDEELMSVPEFRKKLSNARLASGMEMDKITGYTSFKLK